MTFLPTDAGARPKLRRPPAIRHALVSHGSYCDPSYRLMKKAHPTQRTTQAAAAIIATTKRSTTTTDSQSALTTLPEAPPGRGRPPWSGPGVRTLWAQQST